MTINTLLYIAKTWPEPNSTAAGRRTLDVLSIFIEQGVKVTVACCASDTEFSSDLDAFGINSLPIKVNCDSFNQQISDLAADVVIFDRFMTEEQFSWRVKQQLPQCMLILDTSDFHGLRHAREQQLKNQRPLQLNNEVTLREVASITRCDLSIMISLVEIELLISHFNIREQKLIYLPFLFDLHQHLPHSPDFKQRVHMMMIGNFLHKPNWDANLFCVQSIWPIVRNQLPHAELHIYGAYIQQKHQQLHQPKQGVFLKGRADNALETMAKYRLTLAPLRFGAGQKGKVFESFISGTPCIGSEIALESMAQGCNCGYNLSQSAEVLAENIIDAYQDDRHWQHIQNKGYHILRKNFNRQPRANHFFVQIKQQMQQLTTFRQNDFWQTLLWQQQFRSTEFMSRWISEKNRL